MDKPTETIECLDMANGLFVVAFQRFGQLNNSLALRPFVVQMCKRTHVRYLYIFTVNPINSQQISL